MSYILRDYQEKAKQTGVEFFYSKSKKNMVEVLPTAAGKSLVIANIARQLDAPTMIFQPSKELLLQNYEKYISYGNKAAIYSASQNKREIGEVTFATIGSVYRHPELFEHFKYVIVDEAHLTSPKEGSMHQQFLEQINIKLLGLTATPFRLKSYSFPEPHSKLNMLNRMRPKIFQDFIHVTQIQEMIEEGYWSPLHYYVEDFNRDGLVVNTTGANYREDSVARAIKGQGIIERTINWAKKLRKEGRKRILIFAPDIDTSDYLAKKLKVSSVTSYTDKKDRERYISRFKKGLDYSIVNVNILSVGFDEQKIDAIIDLTPTLSLARYYQKLGRGVRIDLSPNPTKEDCIVVDLVGNTKLFGKIEDLVVEKVDNKWAVTSNGIQLTNTVLVRDDGLVPAKELENNLMTFGKFKDEKFKDIPKWYWKYIIKIFPNNEKNKDLLRYGRSVVK